MIKHKVSAECHPVGQGLVTYCFETRFEIDMLQLEHPMIYVDVFGRPQIQVRVDKMRVDIVGTILQTRLR